MRTIPDSVVVGIGKGGSCKTTLATQLAGIWASEGKRVLIADLDMQASATKVVGLDPAQHGAGRHLMDSVMYGDELVTVKARDNLEIVAAGKHTKTLSNHLVTAANGPEAFALPFEKVMAASRFDRIVFDLPTIGLIPPGRYGHADRQIPVGAHQ